MRVFAMFELVVLCALLYLVVNLIRYFFFKETMGGGRIFSLSDKWIRDDKERMNERMKESVFKPDYKKKGRAEK
jgi:hypothetical protein